MSTSPRYIGDTRPLICAFNTDSGTYSVSGLNSSVFAMNFVDTSNGTHTTGTGTWSSITGNTAQYTPNAADVIVTTKGTYKWYPVVNGVTFDPQLIEVLDPSSLD